MKKTVYFLLILFLICSFTSCVDPTIPPETETEDFFVPEFYQGLTASKSIDHPQVGSISQMFESGYIKYSPFLLRLKKDTEHEAGDTISSSLMGTPVTITTKKTGSVIEYSISDADGGLSISMAYDTAAKKLDYSQKSIVFAPSGTITGISQNLYDVVYIEMNDAEIGADLGFQAKYSILYYQKKADGSCIIFKTENIEFVSTAVLNGFVFCDGTMYQGADPRSVTEVPATGNLDAIKSACSAALLTSGTEVNQYVSMWYVAGVWGMASGDIGQTPESVFESALPWTTTLSWTHRYTVSLYLSTGESIQKIPGIPNGNKITRPADPVRDGFYFAGWFSNSELTNRWDFLADTVSANMMLYAKWTTSPTYTLSFNSNGGSSVVSIEYIEAGSIISAPPVPVKTGETFLGWFKDEGFTEAWDFAADAVTADTILYAKWKNQEPDIYLAGGFNNGKALNACYWKNGTVVMLTTSETFDARATAITVVGEDIYVAGHESNGTNDVAKFWKNGVETILTDGNFAAQIYSIEVDGTDVYTTGFEYNESNHSVAKYWKNTTPVSLTAPDKDGSSSVIIKNGADIYIAGKEENVLKIWKNEEPTNLTDGAGPAFLQSMFISGTDVYAAGFEHNGTQYIAKVWKNGTTAELTDGTNFAMAQSVFVSGSDVYAAGYEVNGSACEGKYWINGTPVTMTTSMFSNAPAIIVVSENDVYFSCTEINGSTIDMKLWKNGVEQIIETGFYSAMDMIIIP